MFNKKDSKTSEYPSNVIPFDCKPFTSIDENIHNTTIIRGFVDSNGVTHIQEVEHIERKIPSE